MHQDELLIDLQVLWSPRNRLERVYEHVAGEGDVEVTEPQQLSAMAQHGSLKKKETCFFFKLGDNITLSSTF